MYLLHIWYIFHENNGAHCNKGNHTIQRWFGVPTLHTLKGIEKRKMQRHNKAKS